LEFCARNPLRCGGLNNRWLLALEGTIERGWIEEGSVGKASKLTCVMYAREKHSNTISPIDIAALEVFVY
jgi:hypothetical protein